MKGLNYISCAYSIGQHPNNRLLYNVDFTGNKFLGIAKPELFMLTGSKRKFDYHLQLFYNNFAPSNNLLPSISLSLSPHP